MDNEGFEGLVRDIRERMEGLDEIRTLVSEERIGQIVREQLDLVVQDEGFVRKMRFGGAPASQKMLGSKYARWGLGIEDIDMPATPERIWEAIAMPADMIASR